MDNITFPRQKRRRVPTAEFPGPSPGQFVPGYTPFKISTIFCYFSFLCTFSHMFMPCDSYGDNTMCVCRFIIRVAWKDLGLTKYATSWMDYIWTLRNKIRIFRRVWIFTTYLRFFIAGVNMAVGNVCAHWLKIYLVCKHHWSDVNNSKVIFDIQFSDVGYISWYAPPPSTDGYLTWLIFLKNVILRMKPF